MFLKDSALASLYMTCFDKLWWKNLDQGFHILSHLLLNSLRWTVNRLDVIKNKQESLFIVYL